MSTAWRKWSVSRINVANDQTEGCSGAEIASICQDAALSAMNEDLNAAFVGR